MNHNLDDKRLREARLANIEAYDSRPEYYDYLHLHIEGEAQRIKEIFQDIEVEGKDLLDLGTGTGFIPCNIRSGARLFLLDVSEGLLREALRKLCNKKAYGIRADAQDLPLQDGSMDIITSSSFFHHLPNYRHCLDEIYRVLKTRGMLIIFHEPCKFLRPFLYKLLTILHFEFESISPDKSRQRLKIRFKQKFPRVADASLTKLKELEAQAHCCYGFDPYNFLGGGFEVKAIKTYYPHYCLFNKILEFCFLAKGPLFHIIVQKKTL